jgi:hypothetical protein
LCCSLLRDDFTGVELNQHGSVGFDLLDGDRQPEVVQEQELEFKVIQLGERKAANLLKFSTR